MALRGNLKDFSLPDVFQLVTLSGKTGVLRIRRDSATGSVWFREGEVFFAQSDWQSEPLGARLVSAGRITSAALDRALQMQAAEPQGGRRLGEILVGEGYISEKVLEAFVQEQIQDTIFDLFRWDEGDFDFEPLTESPMEDIGLSVSIENIVMEGSRRLDEWNRIKKKIPSMDIVFKMATAPGEGTFDISLKPTEWNLLLKVDGTRSVSELAREIGRTDFEVARVVYGLFSAGLLEVASDEEVERLRAERVVWERRLAEDAAARKAQEAERAAAAPQPEPQVAAAPVESVAPVAPESAAPAHVTEEPAYLTAEAPSASDMAVFEQMMGAVLTPEPVAPAEATAPAAPVEPAPEVVPEPLAVEAPPVEPLAVEAPPVEPLAVEAPPVEPLAAEAPSPEADVIPPSPYVEELIAAREAPPPAPPIAEEPEVELPAEPLGYAEGPAEPALEWSASAAPGVLDAAADDLSALAAPVDEQPLEELLQALGDMSGAEPTVLAAEPEIAEPAFAAEPEPVQETLPAAPGRTGDFAADLMALGLGEVPEVEDVLIVPGGGIAEEEGLILESEEPLDASQLAGLLDSLESETGVEPLGQVISTGSLRPEGEEAEGGQPSAVISTDAFLADFEVTPAGLGEGLGDELTALTGGGSARVRPQVTASKLPEEGAPMLRRDSHVDRELVERIIEGVKNI